MSDVHDADKPGEHLTGQPSTRRMAAERLRFVVRFAQMNLDALRPGDWLNLRDDFWMFFGIDSEHELPPRSLGVYCTPHEDISQISEDTIRTLQHEIQGFLRCVLDMRVPSPGGRVHQSRDSNIMHIDKIRASYYSLEGDDGPGAGERMLFLRGSFRDAFRLAMLFDLMHQPTEHIRRCPECQTIFYRVGKQQYCSRPCVNRANVRNWRQSEEGKQHEQERAHQRYIKKVGEGPKVTRRPRKEKTDHAETSRES